MKTKIKCPRCKATPPEIEYIDRVYKYHRFEVNDGAVELNGDATDTIDDEGWSGELRCCSCSTVFAVPDDFWEEADWV